MYKYRYLLYIAISIAAITSLVFCANRFSNLNGMAIHMMRYSKECRDTYGNDMKFSVLVFQSRSDQNSVMHAQITGGISGRGKSGDYIVTGYYDDRKWKVISIMVTGEDTDIFIHDRGDSLE